MSADARPPEILIDACDDPTVLDEAEPPAAVNRVPEGGDAAVADGDASEVVVRKPGTTGGQPCGRPDDWPSRPKRDRRPPGRLQDYVINQAAQSTCGDHYGQTKAENGSEEFDQTKTGLDGETDE